MELNMKNTITLLLFIFPVVSLSLENNGFRVELNHVDSKSNFTQIELLNRAAARTTRRWSRLMGMQLYSSTNISSTVMFDTGTEGEYLMDLAIGNPLLYYSAILDTGSDLIWTQCTPCKRCVSQPTSVYDPSKSSTVSSIPCNSTSYQYLCNTTIGYLPPGACLCSYNYTYGTGWTSGTLKRETFTFGTSNPVQVSSPLFGCSTSSSDDFNGTAGLVGFSRGPFSLPSQLNISMFSYCLGSFMDVNSKSSLFIGPWANFSGTTIKSTSFIKSPSGGTFAHYYISLLGISLGTTKLAIPPSTFSLQSNGSGGIFIDSGTTITNLVNEAYLAVKDAIDSIITLHRVNASDVSLDLCYYLPSGTPQPAMPDMTFHFEDADMVLPKENYMMSIPYDNGSLWCLAMSGASDSRSIFGNYQQQNFHFLYDLSGDVLSFAPAKCDNL